MRTNYERWSLLGWRTVPSSSITNMYYKLLFNFYVGKLFWSIYSIRRPFIKHGTSDVKPIWGFIYFKIFIYRTRKVLLSTWKTQDLEPAVDQLYPVSSIKLIELKVNKRNGKEQFKNKEEMCMIVILCLTDTNHNGLITFLRF